MSTRSSRRNKEPAEEEAAQEGAPGSEEENDGASTEDDEKLVKPKKEEEQADDDKEDEEEQETKGGEDKEADDKMEEEDKDAADSTEASKESSEPTGDEEKKDKTESATDKVEEDAAEAAKADAAKAEAAKFAVPQMPVDPKMLEEQEIIKNNEPESELEHALVATLKRKDAHIDRLSGEVQKLKAFISKRKQTYKRKRKDEGAPTRALSAYNIFVQDRFSQLAKENELALRSADTDAQLKRVPPASLVASTGNQWKELSVSDKASYEERAKSDRKRYEEQMAKYQPPDKQANRKRNKTGYNMFFSAHVLRLKQSESGVPSERGSVARLVGNAWKVSHRYCF